MARSKVRYELINDRRLRHETFKKRKAAFFKKLDELKTLCDIDMCAFVISEDGTQSEAWPSQPEASHVVGRFLDLPSSVQTNNTVNQDGFLRQNLTRLSNNLERETKRIEVLEMELCLAECLRKEMVDVADTEDLEELLCVLERKMRLVDRHIEEAAPSTSTRVRGSTEQDELLNRKGKQPI